MNPTTQTAFTTIKTICAETHRLANEAYATGDPNDFFEEAYKVIMYLTDTTEKLRETIENSEIRFALVVCNIQDSLQTAYETVSLITMHLHDTLLQHASKNIIVHPLAPILYTLNNPMPRYMSILPEMTTTLPGVLHAIDAFVEDVKHTIDEITTIIKYHTTTL